ncbi:MAG: DUF3500 domain-containing protein, partial [Kangiellaceae bacterium]
TFSAKGHDFCLLIFIAYHKFKISLNNLMRDRMSQFSHKFIYILFILIGSLMTAKVTLSKGNQAEKEFEVHKNSFMMKMQAEALKSPFDGVTTSDGKIEGLFPIRSTGISTAPIVEAGNKFLTSLSNEQKRSTLFDVRDDEWRRWSNVDHGIFERQGISLKEMNKKQRGLAFKLMQESLSAKGLQLSKDIMKTDQTLRELNNNNPIFDEELYFITIMGKPSATEPWGWQIDGHHLVINYFILGDQVVMTPTFMGGEPIVTTTGKYKGNTLFQDEQNIGLKFMQSLSKQHQTEATLSTMKNHNNAKTEAFKDNVTLDFQGLKASKMSQKQKSDLLNLAEQYISNMRDEHTKVKMAEIKNHINDTYFSWVGKVDDNAVFYYRIHSPVILIEFDHQGAIGIRSEHRGATRNHIHTVVRTPNGNDYGKDLLKQHIEKHHKH